ncbi:EVE domain-containing protein [Cystobacter fuscus]
MSRNWIAVASAEHVLRGREAGFMQVCHGKAAPLRRLQPGDRVIYYSPTVSFQGKDRLQAFTALGLVKAGEPYVFDMGGGFRPFRRDVTGFQHAPRPSSPCSSPSTSRRGDATGATSFASGCSPSASMTCGSSRGPWGCGFSRWSKPPEHGMSPGPASSGAPLPRPGRTREFLASSKIVCLGWISECV